MYATQFYALNVVITKTLKDDVDYSLVILVIFSVPVILTTTSHLIASIIEKYFVSNITYNWQTTTANFKIGNILSMEWIYLVKILGTLLLV